MAQYEPLEQGVEVNGQTILSFLEGVPSPFTEKASTILENNGISDPQPRKWYPQKKWLSAFEEIEENVGKRTLKTIGKSIPDNADWPPEIDSVEEGIKSIDKAYHTNHRNGEIGHYTVESVEENEAVIKCTNPYPCEFDRGIIEGIVEDLTSGLPRVEEVGDECRDSGGSKCRYKLKW